MSQPGLPPARPDPGSPDKTNLSPRSLCPQQWRPTPASKGSFHWRYFHGNLNSMEIYFYYPLRFDCLIAVWFCVWPTNYNVLACAINLLWYHCQNRCCDVTNYDGKYVVIWVLVLRLHTSLTTVIKNVSPIIARGPCKLKKVFMSSMLIMHP